MEPSSTTEEFNSPSETDKPTATTSRPTTLHIPVDTDVKSQLLPPFRTPTLNDLQPLLRSEVEKLLQQWKVSPQTPNSFLNPKHVTEDQECFANAFTQKLNELQDSGCLASITAAMSPTVVNSSGLYNVSLSDLSTPNLPNFADLCRQAVQQQQSDLPTPPILLYSPTALQSQAMATSHVKSSLATNPQQPPSFDLQKCANDLTNLQNQLQGSVSITLPVAALSGSSKDLATLQLANRLKFEITANGDVSQASVLKILGLGSTSSDLTPTTSTATSQPTLDPLLWPLRVQTSTANESIAVDSQNHFHSSPRDDIDTRPSSVSNSVDQVELNRPVRSPSSVSSNSSTSHANGTDPSTGHDTLLDPTEQYRMRLERKRARNRDAARKCRERKIRLIKSLEKDVYHLSEENKALRTRVSRSRNEVERLKSFVVNHLEKECPAIAGKVV